MIRVLLKHDCTLWRHALQRMLDQEPGVTVVGQLGRGEDVTHVGRRVRPDVVLIDGGLLPSGADEADFASLCEALPGSAVLVLVDGKRPAAIRPVVARLAPQVGVVTTDETSERLVEAVYRLNQGHAVFGPEIALAALRAGDNPLTEREREVLSFLATGADTREIADRLFLSRGTVRNYLSNALAKTGARTRIDAVRIAQESGWI